MFAHQDYVTTSHNVIFNSTTYLLYIYQTILDLLHMTTKQIDNAVNDLKPAVDALLHSEYADGTTIRINTDTQSTQTSKEVF